MGFKQGQQQILNIIIFLLTVVIAAVFTPIISTFMNDAINSSNATGTTLLLMQNVVTVFWIGIIITFFMMIGSMRGGQQY